MNENQQSQFSFSELRTIVDISRSPERLKGMAKEVKLLRQTLRQNPDCSWGEYLKIHPSSQEGIKGEDLVKSTFERFKSNRKALLHWRNLYQNNQTKTSDEIRKSLDIPAAANIKNVQFLEDCLAISMDNESVNSFYEYILSKYGERKPKGLAAIGGFVSSLFFLSDEKGNSCQVIIVNESNKLTLPHEREHIVLREYYRRHKTEKPESDERDQRIQHKNKFQKKLENVDKTDYHKVLLAAEQYLKPTLDYNRLLFYEEVISDITSLNLIEEGKRYDQLQRILEYNPNFFQLTNVHALWINHSYGAYMVQVVDGIRDTIMETNLSYRDKLKLCWKLETAGANVSTESRIISKWLLELWNAVHGDLDEYISILETIPFKYISSIGYFINKDPKVLKADILEIKGQEREQGEQVIWRMMVRHAEDTPSIQQLPDIQLHTQKIKDVLKKSCVKDGHFDINKLYSILPKEVVDTYSHLNKQLLESLYPEYVREFKKYKDAGITMVQSEWTVRRFVETYGRKLLNFEAIKNAITELLVENNLADEISEVMKNYKLLLSKEDNDKKIGFGYHIIENEKKVWLELERENKLQS